MSSTDTDPPSAFEPNESHGDDDRGGDPDALVTLTVQPTEFHANSIVVMLNDNGIDARAFGTGTSWLGMPMWPGVGGLRGVPVQVRRRDVEHAREIIKRRIAESVDLDWNDVDIGEPEQLDTSRTTWSDMPWLARLAFAVGIVIILLMIFGVIASIVNP